MRRGRFFRARRRCTRDLFYRTVSHVTRPSRWPADMVTVLQTSRQITVLKDTLREAQDGRADGFWKKSQARVFILHLQIIGAWFAPPSPPPARDAWNVVQRICRGIRRRQGSCWDLRNREESENRLRGSIYAVAHDTSALIGCIR